MTSVASFLVGTVLSAVVILIFQSVFSRTVSEEEAGTVPNTGSYAGLLSSDPSEAVALTEQAGIAPDADDHSPSAEKWRSFFAVTSFAVGVFGSHFGLASLPSGSGYAYKMAIAGIVTGLIGATLSLLDPFQVGSDIATFAGFWCGLFSMATGVVGVIDAMTHHDPFARNVGIVATGIGALSFLLSIASVTYED